MLSVPEAQKVIIKQSRSFGVEQVLLDDAPGRVLAEDLLADRDYPPFNRSTMDGFAIISSDLSKGIREFEVVGEVFAGQVSKKALTSGECMKIMTGAPVPGGADAVVKVGDTQLVGKTMTAGIDEVAQGKNVANRGEDALAGDLLVSRGIICEPPIVGALAVAGKDQVNVMKIPQVSLISTGNEIIPVGKPILPHQIRDSNQHALRAFFLKYKIEPAQRILAVDDKEQLRQAVSKSVGADLLILTGGVSMGDADFVPEILASEGVEKLFHKVMVKPGKPLWFGRLPSGGVAFGLPGNPVSSQVAL